MHHATDVYTLRCHSLSHSSTVRSGAAADAGASGSLCEDLLLPPGDLARPRPAILEGPVLLGRMMLLISSAVLLCE